MSESRTKRPSQQPAPADPPKTATGEAAAAEAPQPTAAAEPTVAASSRRDSSSPEQPDARPFDPLAGFEVARAAFAGTTVAVADEMAGLMRLGIDSTADAATGLLAAKTLGDAFAVNTALACRNAGAALEGSWRLTETGARLAAEAWDQMMPMFGAGLWR